MTILLALAALVSSASPEASPSAGPPPLAEALAKAKATGRPLVLELSTTWCEPCKQFDAEILPAPEVVRALHDVTFVQYDAEKEPGRGAAATFAVSSYPTFLALDAAGTLRERQLGVSDADDFIAFLTRSLAVTLDAASIEARVRAAPNDPQTLLTAARWHATHEHTAEARSSYAKAAASDPRGQVAPEAAWELTGLDQRVRAGASLLEYAARFPSARRAPTAMALGALAGHASPDKVRATLSAYVTANRDDVSRLLEIVTVALAAGAIDSAEAAARRLVELGPGDADACALLAEVHHQRGDKARAVQAADKCLLLGRCGGELPGRQILQQACTELRWRSWLEHPHLLRAPGLVGQLHAHPRLRELAGDGRTHLSSARQRRAGLELEAHDGRDVGWRCVADLELEDWVGQAGEKLLRRATRRVHFQ